MVDNIYERLADLNWQGRFEMGTPMRPTNAVFKLLADSGGNTNMATDSTVAGSAENWRYKVDSGFIFIPERLNILIMNTAIEPPKFGGHAALATGLGIEWVDTDGTTVLLDFLDGAPIKKNADWGLLAGVDADKVDTLGAADDAFFTRWTIAKSGLTACMLSDETFRVVQADSMGDNTEISMMLQGVRFPDTTA